MATLTQATAIEIVNRAADVLVRHLANSCGMSFVTTAAKGEHRIKLRLIDRETEIEQVAYLTHDMTTPHAFDNAAHRLISDMKRRLRDEIARKRWSDREAS